MIPERGDNYVEIKSKKIYRVMNIEKNLDSTIIELYGWSKKVSERFTKKVNFEQLEKDYKICK